MNRYVRMLAFAGTMTVAVSSWAQTKPSAAVAVKRTPAPRALESADQKRIQADIDALRQDPLADPNIPVRLGNPDPGRSSVGTVPPDFKPKSDLPLSPAAEAAVQVSEKWLTEPAAPATGPDGRVLYSYGAGLATVVCAPLRVCTVELQAGESLVGEPHIGDSVRWNVAPALYGKGDSSTTVIIIKPQSPGLDTTLLITTDRRVYYVRLVSKPEEYTARVAFAYPNDESDEQKWKEHAAQQEREKREASHIADVSAGALESMNFDYAIKGNTELRPVQIFDDGVKTYIRMKPELVNREAPVLVVVGPDGQGEMVNYRVKGDMYIADRIFERAQMVLGAGKKAQKVEIRRGTAKGKS